MVKSICKITIIVVSAFSIGVTWPSLGMKQEKFRCAICQEELIKLNCKHISHKKCLNRWFLENNSCPVCRNQEFCFKCCKPFKQDDVIKNCKCKSPHKYHTQCVLENPEIERRCPLYKEEDANLPTVNSPHFTIMLYKTINSARVFNKENHDLSNIELQSKNIIMFKILFNRFLLVGYQDHEIEIFDLQNNNYKYPPIKLQTKNLRTWAILNNRFFIATYQDLQTEIFDLQNNNHKYPLIKLKPKNIVTLDILNNRFLTVKYQGHDVDIFDLQDNNKKYALQIATSTIYIDHLDTKDNRFFVLISCKKPITDKYFRCEANIYDLQDSQKLPLQSKGSTEVQLIVEPKGYPSWYILSERFFVFYYTYIGSSDTFADTFEIFDFINKQTYKVKLKNYVNHNIKNLEIKDNRHLFVNYKDGSDETITFNDKSSRKRKPSEIEEEEEEQPSKKKRKIE